MRSAVAAAGVLALVALGLAGAFLLAQSDTGRERLARWLAPVLSAATGYRVEIVGIDRGLPSRIGIDRLSLADAHGTWLTLEGLSLSWKPAEIMRGRLAVGALHAHRLEIARAPEAHKAQNERTTLGDFALAQSPVDVSIGRLAVEALVLGEAVLGEPARLRVEGRLAAPAADVISTDVTIVRTDGREGRLAASVQLDPDSRRLRLEATADEAENGLLVRLLGLGADPAISLRLNGDGPVEDWRGVVTAEAKGLASVAGDLAAAAAATGYRIGFDGRANWHGWMPAVLRPAIASGIRIGFRSELENASLILDTLRLDARDLAVEGSGRLDLATSAIAAQGNVALGPKALAPEALAGYRLEGIGAEAVVSGRFDAIAVAAAGTVSRLSGPAIRSANLAWQASLAQPDAGAWPMRVAAQATAVSTQDPRLGALLGPAPSAQVEARLAASGNALDLQSAHLTLPAATVSASGRLALNDAPSELRIEGVVADLAALQPLLGVRAKGEARIVAQVQGPLLAGTAAAQIEGAAKNLRTGIAVADAALGATPVLTCSVHVEPSRGLALSDLRLDGANVRITGEGRTNAAFTQPEARVRISLGKARVAGLAVEAVEIIGVASHLDSRPAGDVRAKLKLPDGPVEAESPFAVEDGWLRLTGLSATGFGARAAGDLDVELASGLWRGQIHAGLPAGGRMSFGRSQLSGRADLDIRLTPIAGRQAVDAKLQGTALAFGDAGGEAVRIGHLEASVRVDDAFGAGRIDASARASTIGIGGGGGPGSLTVRAAGPPEAIDARIEVDGPEDRLDRVAASARINVSGGSAAMTVIGLDGVAGGSRIRLASPLRVSRGGGRLLIEDVDLAVGNGRLAGRLDLSPGTTSGVLRLEKVPLRILRGWVPAAPAAGTLTGSGGVTTSEGIVGGELALSFDQLRFTAATATAPAAIDADFRAAFGQTGTELRIIARHTGDFASTLLLATVILPLWPVPGAPMLHTSPTAPLTGDVRIRADLARLAEVLEVSDQRLGGTLAGDLRLDGSLSRPEILGELAIHDGVYENFVTGTLISGIAARADMREGRAVRLTLSGTPAGGGSMAAEGRIDLAAGAPEVELRVDARDARLVARDDVTAAFGGQMTCRYGRDGGRLAGILTVTPVEIRLRDRLPASVVLLPVIEINKPGGGAVPPRTASAPALVAALDVQIDLPGDVFVRGRGLESAWAGALHAGGTTSEPTLAGEVHLVRGDFTFASKRLRLQRGVIGFTGGSVIDPLLDVAAEYRTPQLTALIEATGPVSEPAIVVSSQPPLPESEVLAQVMFGKAPARLSALEAVQLAAALDSLNRGDTFSADTLASVRQLLGLEVLNVGPAGAGAERGASLEVGRYFGQHVFVGTRRGLADQTSAGRVEVEIVPGLSLQSDILQDVQGMSGSLGLQFKHDY